MGFPTRRVVLLTAAVLMAAAGGLIGWLGAIRSSGRRIAAARGLPHPAVVAHRGASALAPENTLPAFELAAALGADYVETDVQRSRDGVLFCFHDKTPGGDLRGPEQRPERVPTDVAAHFPGRVREPVGGFTWAELRRLDAGAWFNERHQQQARPGFVGVRIPSFDEYMDAVAARPGVGLLIELKSPELYPGIEEQVVRALLRRGWEVEPPLRWRRGSREAPGVRGAVVLQSFSLPSVQRLRAAAPLAHLNFLVKERDAQRQGWSRLLEQAVAADAHIGPVGYLGWPWYTGPAHRAGRLVIVWTVDDRWQFHLLTLCGADWLITNRPDALLGFHGRASPEDPAAILGRLGY